jgi:hypothetical protein
MTVMDDRDADRLLLLDRIADRIPELELDQRQSEWTKLDDGHEALLGGGRKTGAGWGRSGRCRPAFPRRHLSPFDSPP